MAGTADGRVIARLLHQQGFPVLVTVTTEHGRILAEEDGLKVLSGMLDSTELAAVIRNREVWALVDATHPYAVAASQNAQEAARETGIPYFRFERPQSDIDEYGVRCFDSLDDLVAAASETDVPTLLTIGSNQLEPFAALPCRDFFYIRVLPTTAVIEKCTRIGIRADRILAMQGPFSAAFNIALMRQWGIARIITKDGSGTGGFPEKLEAARSTGTEFWVLGRPVLEYPNSYSDPAELVNAVLVASKQS